MIGQNGSQGSAEMQEESLKLFRQRIIRALLLKKQGNAAEYSSLLLDIDSIRGDQARLRVFTQCVSHFDEFAHETLLLQLLGVSLWRVDQPIADVIVEFAVNLASSNASCLTLCLDSLVRNFLPPSCGLPLHVGLTPRNGPGGVGALLLARQGREEDLKNKERVLTTVVSALGRVAKLVPATAMRLGSLLVQRMPHKRVEKEFQCIYFEALFLLAESEGGRALADRVLAAAVDRLIEIDVEIRWEDILSEARQAGNRVYLFHMDLDDDSDEECVHAPRAIGNEDEEEEERPGREASLVRHGFVHFSHTPSTVAPLSVAPSAPGTELPNAAALPSVSGLPSTSSTLVSSVVTLGSAVNSNTVNSGAVATAGSITPADSAPLPPSLDEMADKMDALMSLTFMHLQRRAALQSPGKVFTSLTNCFETTILGTFKSKFTQFLLFYACSLSSLSTPPSSSLSSSFATLLCSILTSPSRPANTRMSAAAYLASFLARGAFIPLSVVASHVRSVLDWCLEYAANDDRKQQAKSSGGAFRSPSGLRASFSSHSVFYAACQAILYVLCYRMASWAEASGSVPPANSHPAIIKSHQSGHTTATSAHPSASSSSPLPHPSSLPLMQLLSHPLHPLLPCLDSVVLEFSRQASALHVFDPPALSLLLDARRKQQQRIRDISNYLSPAGAARGGGGGAAAGGGGGGVSAAAANNPGGFGGESQLDMFFPFDPYLLHDSLRFIRPIFNKWRPPAVDEESEEEEDSEESEDEREGGGDQRGRRKQKGTGSSSSCSSSDDEGSCERMPMSVSGGTPGTSFFEAARIRAAAAAASGVGETGSFQETEGRSGLASASNASAFAQPRDPRSALRVRHSTGKLRSPRGGESTNSGVRQASGSRGRKVTEEEEEEMDVGSVPSSGGWVEEEEVGVVVEEDSESVFGGDFGSLGGSRPGGIRRVEGFGGANPPYNSSMRSSSSRGGARAIAHRPSEAVEMMAFTPPSALPPRLPSHLARRYAQDRR